MSQRISYTLEIHQFGTGSSQDRGRCWTSCNKNFTKGRENIEKHRRKKNETHENQYCTVDTIHTIKLPYTPSDNIQKKYGR
jgi:hypothetical protein